MNIRKATEKDFNTMADIWEEALADSYEYLRMSEIIRLKKIVLEKYFPNKDFHYYILDNQSGSAGFVGIINNKIEFLFVNPDEFGKGYGRELLLYSLENHNAKHVDIHQQNVYALSFYSKAGFKVVSKSNKDIFGNSYPVCHLELDEKNIENSINELKALRE